MAMTEAARHELYEALRRSIGDGPTLTLMGTLASFSGDEVATKRDVESLRGELRSEMAELRGDFAELRGDFAELRGDFGELRGEFGELRGELRGELGGLRGELYEALATHQRNLLLGMVTTLAAYSGVAIAAGLLG